jgi:hypothetical protein
MTKTIFLLTILTTGIIFLSSCDANLVLSYQVQNDTKNNLKLKIDNYPTGSGLYSKTIDTIIELKPKQWVIVGWDKAIGFPWETKKIYKKNPGRNNFKIVNGDSNLNLNTADKFWKYKHRTSQFKIK